MTDDYGAAYDWWVSKGFSIKNVDLLQHCRDWQRHMALHAFAIVVLFTHSSVVERCVCLCCGLLQRYIISPPITRQCTYYSVLCGSWKHEYAKEKPFCFKGATQHAISFHR